MREDISNYGMTEISDWFKTAIEEKGKENRAEMIELADLLDRALHRSKPKNRVLTLEELKVYTGFLWNESRYGSFDYEGEPAFVEKGFMYAGNGNVDLRRDISDTYGKNWRCWLRKPTKEEMEGTPWGEGEN